MSAVVLVAVALFVAAPSALAQGSRNFHADLAAEWQTKYTESPATGRADFHLDLATLTFSWEITFKDLLAPVTTVRVHGPAQPGANGGVMLEIAGKGAKSPLKGEAKITEAHVQYLLYGWTYLNITTEKYPLGEIRGQLDVRAPQEARQ
ncbi:MAG: CHRD domain-containing protein [Rhodospirillaceae bacterium]|nr:CHRD domain-containing protein [Rhodospirillaceae bacterium]